MVLREMSAAEVTTIAAWERDSENAPFIIPWEEERHRTALDDEDLRHFILDHDGRSVGFVLLAGVGRPVESVEFRRIVVVEKGHGFGKAAVEAVKRHCFDELGARRLWLDVVEANHRARRLYEGAGFREDEVLVDALQKGDALHSLVVMSMAAAEYHGVTS